MIDKIVLSVDGNKDYRDMIPYAIAGWKRFFPEVKVVIVDITIDSCAIPGVPSCNLAKVARFYAATKFENEVCMIHDMDSICLQREYYENKLKDRKPGELLAIGGDFYKGTIDSGKFPIGYMTAEGYVFKEIFNPKDLSWERWIDYLKSIKGIKENICSPFKIFSDETLIKYLLRGWNGTVKNLPMGYVLRRDCVCRWAPLNIKRMNTGGYIEAHHLLPIGNYQNIMQEIKKYIGME